MSRRIANVPALLTLASTEDSVQKRHGATLGHVVELGGDGVVFVDFPGNTAGPLPARRIGVMGDEVLREAEQSGAQVVLVFEDGHPHLPLILSVCESSSGQRPVADAVKDHEDTAELRIDGHRLVLQGTEQIELRCGDASIVLHADGTLKLRGRDIASLARRRQRIKGGTVAIN